MQDIWYYVLSAGIGVTLSLLGYDTGMILTATSGINTPLALVKTGMDKYSERKDNAEIIQNRENIQAMKDKLAELEARKSG